LIRIRKGVATQHPEKYVLDEKELQRVSALSRVELEEMKKEIEKAQKRVEITNDEDENSGDEHDNMKE
jgi:periodic tryptophan protein 1